MWISFLISLVLIAAIIHYPIQDHEMTLYSGGASNGSEMSPQKTTSPGNCLNSLVRHMSSSKWMILLSTDILKGIHHFPTYVLDIVTTHIYCKKEAWWKVPDISVSKVFV